MSFAQAIKRPAAAPREFDDSLVVGRRPADRDRRGDGVLGFHRHRRGRALQLGPADLFSGSPLRCAGDQRGRPRRACSSCPLRLWQQAAPYLFLFGAALLFIVLIPGIGREVNGSRRWLPLVVMNLQPSELMKLFVVLYAADYTVRKAAWMHSLRKGFAPMLAVMLFVGALLLREPDFGAFAVITCIAMGVLFLGGMNWRLFVGLFVLLVIGFVVVILTSPYRMQRILGFMDPWADPVRQRLSAVPCADRLRPRRVAGRGARVASVEKLFYLPEAHTDFLLAVIGEELGFVGVSAVILLFAWLTARAFAIGAQAAKLERYFNALVAQAIGIWLGAQAVINMGVNMGLLPTKGLTLPFLSFGGSGLLANCCASRAPPARRLGKPAAHARQGRVTRCANCDVWSSQGLPASVEANLCSAEVKRQRCRSQNRQRMRGRVM